jgi:hypothetical protein
LELYPTTLTQEDANPNDARPWQFTQSDIFRLSAFSLQVGNVLGVEIGPADLGIGHCADGAVWAIVIPRAGGTLTSQATNQPEAIATLWLRFHPSVLTNLFPPETVFSGGDQSLFTEMEVIATVKMNSSWQAGGNAMIPPPDEMTVDADTVGGPRRFFDVFPEAGTADYASFFESRAVTPPPAITPDLAQATFDQLWEAFDQTYAMFVIRPEVDWTALRDQYRPLALASASTYELAGVCADILAPLQDLHVWLTVAGDYVPLFDRPRPWNLNYFNPGAASTLLGGLNSTTSAYVQWAVTPDKIGCIAVSSLPDDTVSAAFDQALLQMADTRGLILDVRHNSGGDELVGRRIAGRFLDQPFTYAYDQVRNGPNHNDLTAKMPRTVLPGSQWRYDRPVLLLIGQRCISSGENFVEMMTGAPQVTTMGDHTAGSSGNPEIVQLPLAMIVSVPQWIDYLADGTLLDDRGIAPQIPFAAPPEAFEGTRDDLLSAALDRMRTVPLPPNPIPISGLVLAGQWPGYDRGEPSAVAVSGNYACVAAGVLQVIDVSNPAKPQRIGLWAEPHSYQVSQVALAGQYALVTDEAGDFYIIDISDPANPQQVAALQLLGATGGLAVSGNYAYLAGGLRGLSIVDISNPQRPLNVGSFGTNVSAVAVSSNYAYMVGSSGLAIVDVSNPQQPQPVGSCQTGQTGQYGSAGVAVAGGCAYLASWHAGLQVVDVADPANPHIIGAFSNKSLVCVRVAVSGGLAAVIDDLGSDVEMIDVTDPTNPRLLGKAATSSTPAAVVLAGTNAYMADDGAGLEVFSIAQPAQPQRLGYCQVYGDARGVAISGNYACLADMQGGLQVIGIADPAHPQWIAGFDLDGHASVRSVAVTGTYACMADYSTGLHVIDLAAAGGPREVGAFPLSEAIEVAAWGTHAYVADSSVVHSIDLSNPASPSQVGTWQPSSGFLSKLAATSNYLYAAVVGPAGVTILDVSNPAKMQPLGTVNTNWIGICGMAASGGYVCVADEFRGLYVIDVSSPSQPRLVGWYGGAPGDPVAESSGVALSGPIAYDLSYDGLVLVSLTNPSAPQLLNSQVVGAPDLPAGNAIAVNANRICVAAGESGLLVLRPIPSPPRFDGPPPIEADGCHLSFVAEAGQSIVLQRSQDLVTWQDWLTLTGQGSTQEVTDPDALGRPVQFYRAVVQ